MAEEQSGDHNLQFRLSRFDAQIKMEFDLIGYRMTWLMTSQAFLFTAFTVCVTANEPRMVSAAVAIQYIVPIVGMLSAFLVALAIGAAHDVVASLKPAREKLETIAERKGYEVLGVDTQSRDHWIGNLPSRILPWVLAGLWLVLLGFAAHLY
jgi:hypothetical protein|nr:hypothetical protein [uncultured Albidiferax sp.]